MIIIATSTKFPLGQLVVTTNAQKRISPRDINAGLRRHGLCDWGNVCPEDAAMNDEALVTGDRLLSSYGTGDQVFWIITESDRSVTTILLPEDY